MRAEYIEWKALTFCLGMKWYLFPAFLLLAQATQAQWTSDAEANTLAAASAMDIFKALSRSDGSTVIVYWMPVGPPANIELRVQRLDADGMPAYGADGMLVSPDIDMSTSTAIATAVMDAEDNLYIGVTATGDEEGHVFKLDPQGNHLWPSGGVTFPGGYSISILPLSTGGAVVSWLNVPNALMQRYDATGSPFWSAPQPVESGSSKTAPGHLCALSNGDIEHLFHTYNFGISSTLWAQRYDGATGAAVWSNPVQLSNKTTVWNTRYSTGQIGDAVYIGYKAATGLRFDSFLQRVDPDGSIPWGMNGSDFDVNETDYEMDTRIAIGDGVVWSLCNYKDPSQSENGERIQRFDAETGSRQLTDNAKEVYAIGTDNIHASDLHLMDGHPFYLMESGFDNGVSNTTLHLVALDGEGDFLWPEESQPMGLYEASKSRTHLTSPAGGQTVAVWLEDKSAGPAVYAQHYQFGGAPSGVDAGWPEVAVTVYPNPSSDVVHLEWASAASAALTVRVVDTSGRPVFIADVGHQPTGESTFQIDVSDWPDGVYRVLVSTKGESQGFSTAVVVEH